MIRNIWAVGRNYTDHAKELGNVAPASDSDPLFFLKAGSSIVEHGGNFVLPRFSKDIHHEVEIAFRFGPRLELDAISIAIDLTARDAQSRAKSQGSPWTLAKSFRDACLLGPFRAFDARQMNLQEIAFQLKINGEIRQRGNTRDMIHPVEKLRRYAIDCFPVVESDVLITGTPAGVGPVHAGDLLEAEIQGLLSAHWRAASTTG